MIYEGEYLKGKKSGKGKEFDEKNLLIYEGDFLNGKRNGKGKSYEYKSESIIMYEGGIFRWEGEWFGKDI